ncbi:MAG: neutral/alkaline non-lysosomal ceramidase N-terminal domain-containing protein [Pirellulaceae bacterium]|nr:neutral/alkaline non-lysosomal ceramidase N-terminal domain-containing protein [Pirellulaceae bacterium]HJN07783.1 neutral/alkaline non-lysosomal ceramidase N-terminal domain-containing protein [Pirellulaceae bacterium]
MRTKIIKPSAVAVLLVLLACWNTDGKAAEAYQWKAATTSTVITPDGPLWMAGYSSRDRPSGEASQDLYAKVLAVEDAAGSRLVIVTTDLVGITESMRQAVEQQVLDRFELPPAALLMNASHTHSGPEVRIDRLRLEEREGAWIERAEQYVRETTDRIVAAIGQALAKLEPAMLSYTSARCGFAMNRRLVTASGVHGRPNPDGPVDHTVPVLRVDSVDGKKLRAVMFGYACHNTVLGLYDLNGDYAGWAQHYLEEAHPNMTALFVIGCGGDQNPYPRRTHELAQQHGRTLSNSVEAALDAQSKPLVGPLRTALERTSLSFAKGPSRAELHTLAESKSIALQRHARRLLRQLDEGDGFIKEYAYPVQVARFGDGLTLVGLAGETVVDYSLRLKRELAGPNVWVAGYCNTLPTYIPSLRVLREGGYEGGDHRRYTNFAAPFDESIERRITGKVHQLNERLGGKRAD